MSVDLSSALRRPLEWWPAPAAPETSERYNRVGVRRFGLGDTPAAILILSAGFFGGINLLDYLAETVVAATGGRIQVWTTERRNNLLEDTTGMQQAEAAADPRVALEYYFPGSLYEGVDERRVRFVPLAQATVSFLRHWGLGVALADLRVVVQRARAVVGGGKLFLGGHSLGGMLAQCYAAWAFPEGPGYRELDGLVLIDGAVGGPDWTRETGMAQYHDDMAAIQRGEFYWDDPARGATPRIGLLGQIGALAAALPAWRDQPSLVAPLLPDLLPLPPGLVPTNEAALGLAIDPETGPIPNFHAHVGRLGGGVGGQTSDVRGEGRDTVGSAPAPQALHPVPWTGFRETGELSDLQRIAQALRQTDGANGIEWYASRLLNAEIDLSSNLDSRDPETGALAARHGVRLQHHGEEGLPVLGVATGSSVQKRERYRWYAGTIGTDEVTFLDLSEQEHLDPLFAENDGRNRFFSILTEWLLARVSN